MVTLPQSFGILGRLKGLWPLSISPKQKPEPSETSKPFSLDDLLERLPEEQRGAAILGVVKQGRTDEPGYVVLALEEMQKDEKNGPYACAKFAIEHNLPQKAVEIYTANELYGNAIGTLLDAGKLDGAMELFPNLPKSKGFFSRGKLYGRAAKLALISLDTRVENLQELALSSYHEDSRFEEEGRLAEKWQKPKRAIEAYLAGAEKDKMNVLFWYKHAARVAKSLGDISIERRYLRQAAEALIDDELNRFNADKILDLGEEIDDPEIIQKAYELMGKFVDAGFIARTRRGDMEGAIALYLKGNRPDLAAECALAIKAPERAISIYKETRDLETALHIAMDHNFTAEAEGIAKEIVAMWNDKLIGYRALVPLSSPEEADRLSREAELHFARQGMFEDAAEFCQDVRRKTVYLALAEKSNSPLPGRIVVYTDSPI